MSWLTDRINFCKASSHRAPVTVSKGCYSNENHLRELLQEEEARSKERNEECGKLISELWLSRCEESLGTVDPEHLTPKQHGDKLLQATKLKALRRTWQHDAA
jgi:hypothetical protein